MFLSSPLRGICWSPSETAQMFLSSPLRGICRSPSGTESGFSGCGAGKGLCACGEGLFSVPSALRQGAGSFPHPGTAFCTPADGERRPGQWWRAARTATVLGLTPYFRPSAAKAAPVFRYSSSMTGQLMDVFMMLLLPSMFFSIIPGWFPDFSPLFDISVHLRYTMEHIV